MEKNDSLLKLEQLNLETEKIIQGLHGLSTEDLQAKGSGWSIIQVLNHLSESELASLTYMQKKINAGKEMGKTTLGNKMRMRLTNLFQMTNFRWKAPSYISSPPNESDLSATKKNWENTRSEITAFVEGYPAELIDYQVFKHPMAGRQALKEAVSSFIYHQRHHVHQIKRIRKELEI